MAREQQEENLKCHIIDGRKFEMDALKIKF